MDKNKRSGNPIDKVVGSNLRMMRTSAKMSQSSLADEIGVTFQQVQKYERGASRIGASRMWVMCKFFECNPDAFFVGLDKAPNTEVTSSLRTDLYQHPRGPALAKAFLQLDNVEIENQIIAMCRTLSKHS